MPKKNDSHRLDHRPFLVKPGGSFRLDRCDSAYTAGFADKHAAKAALEEDRLLLAAAQDLLWSSGTHSVLIILQALDAAGKDGTIKHVMSGVNPQGCSVQSFKAPDSEELRHHFLWRPMAHLPGHGEITIFNRSYYEEALVVRVHPEILAKQGIDPAKGRKQAFWNERFAEINRFERWLTENGTLVLKFFLNVSRKVQAERLLDRIEDPHKHWKFSPADLKERLHWKDYRSAYQDLLQATSTQEAPWYVIPADHKWFSRACVADIISTSINELPIRYPEVTKEQKAALAGSRKALRAELGI